MAYAPTPCIERNCVQMVFKEGRCKKHQIPAFINHNRQRRLPTDWNTRRNVVLRRDKHTCYVCGEKNATEVDHVINNDDHSLENLKAICRQCHQKKTSREGNQAKANNKPKMVYKKYM
jgi:5-methylcytosine-specific restriction enzyme A